MADIFETDEAAPSGVFWPFWLAVVVTLALLAYGILAGNSAYEFIQESGAVENASVVILFCGALGFAILRPDLAFGRFWHVAVMMLLLTARELDFDKRFTDKGVLQSRLYTGDYPLEQKIIGAFFVLLILVCLYRLVRHGWRPLLSGLKRGAAWAWVFLASFGTVAVAKSLDGAGRKLAPFGIELSEQTTFFLSVLEEVGELGFGLMLVFAICSWVRSDAVEASHNSAFPAPSQRS